MSVSMIAIAAILAWIVLMAAAWYVSWTNVLAGIFVAGVIGLGIVVSWQRVEQNRAQDDAAVAAAVASYNSPTIAPVPPSDHPRAGT